ncbi:hypothetical protein EDC01DRAFT_635842 [Geopyxis carbonaria]|nr:hypothetical protein EDC01DRAFT_635842 [Geopyxis carbonaria]
MTEPTGRYSCYADYYRAKNAGLQGGAADSIIGQMAKRKLQMNQIKQNSQGSVFFAVAKFFSWKPVDVVANLFNTTDRKNSAIDKIDCGSDREYHSDEDFSEDFDEEQIIETDIYEETPDETESLTDEEDDILVQEEEKISPCTLCDEIDDGILCDRDESCKRDTVHILKDIANINSDSGYMASRMPFTPGYMGVATSLLGKRSREEVGETEDEEENDRGRRVKKRAIEDSP